MKRLLFIIAIMLLLAPCVYGEGETYSDDFRYSVAPEDSLLSESTDLNDPESTMEDLDFKKIFTYLFRQFGKGLNAALATLISGVAMVFLSVFMNRCSGNIQNQNLQMLFSFMISLSIVLMCQGSLRSCADALQKAIGDMEIFTAACIPSFSVVMIAAGEGASAGMFSAVMVLVGELGTLIANGLLMPLTDVYLAIGICSAVSDEYNFATIGKNIRRFIVWSISLLTIAFRLILKLQSGVAVAGDQLAKKYIKSAVGGLIPIVGNTLSQGIDGLFAAAVGVKTSFAVAGVLIVLSVMLPSLITIGVHGLVWSLCRWIAEFMNDSTIRSIADVLANSFYLMLALGGSVTLMGLFSFFGVMTAV